MVNLMGVEKKECSLRLLVNNTSQGQKMILKVENDKPNIMETLNSEELLMQLELFEYYRQDSSSDASRNLFGSKTLIYIS
jgi:hypothetical protein